MRSFLILSTLTVFFACTKKEPTYIENIGQAQGTTYQIKYLSPQGQNYHDSIKKIFKDVDMSMSTYLSNSLISTINKGDTLVKVDSIFLEVLNRSLEIAQETNGSFDPTIGPLVRFWGFGFDKIKTNINADSINALKEFTGYKSITIDGDLVSIPNNFNIDFNAIAQGFTADYIARFLESKNIKHFMVEVGGEVSAKGVNENDDYWKIGVDKPQEEIDNNGRFQFIISLNNKALATSGNYRKFWVDEDTGVRYSHTINPKTGYPAKNRLLSASILANTAMDADAYATTCMVIGIEGCKTLLNNNEELEGYLVFDDGNNTWGTFTTDGFQELIVD